MNIDPFKKLLFLLITSLIADSISAQNIKMEKFESQTLETERFLKIYTPPSYQSDSTKYYPLAIVLDAEFLFDVYVGNATLFANKDKAPEQIIVGVNQNYYNERFKDCAYDEETGLPTQDSEDFYRFIRGELFDHMEQNYRISPFKTIVGNTLTANFTNYFLIEQYPSFNAFININPYYAETMPDMLLSKTATLNSENIYYYLCNGDYNVEKRRTLIDSTNSYLSEVENNLFKYKYDVFENSTKTASMGQAIPGGLAFIFDIYSAISSEEFENEIKDLSPPDAIAYLEKKYVEIDYLFGSNLKIRERDIFAIESIILDKENGDYLKSFGEMINRIYEESPLGDYYIGKYYESGRKYKLALRYYKTGYMKLAEGDPDSDGYYKNIERVVAKRNGSYIDPDAEPEEEMEDGSESEEKNSETTP
jgi:predicted alpha/beta superfamily hydrolase